jgi:Fe-S oxidoreductase
MGLNKPSRSSKDKEGIKTRFRDMGKKKRELEEFREMAWNCVNCNYCQEMWSWDVKSADYSYICPSFAKDRYFAYSARGRSQIIRALLEGDFNPTDSKKLIDIAYRCTLCGACEMNCMRLVEREPEKMIEALRAYLLERSMVTSPLKAFLESTVKYDNPFSALKEERVKWTEDLEFKIKDLTKEKGEVLLFVGCMYSLETRLHKVVKAFAEILNIAGVDFGFLGAEEKCCGIEQFRIGDRGIYEELANENIKTFNKLGIKTLVAACPHCYYSFKSYYPEEGRMNFEVLHFTQYLERLIKEGKIKLNELPRQVVTYSDPCNLGRYAGIYDSPREILKAIPKIELREMERNRDQAWCCGAGGGVLTAYPDLATWTAEERVKEAEATGASTFITACPWCEYNLESGIELRKSRLELLDIAEVVLKSIKGGKDER